MLEILYMFSVVFAWMIIGIHGIVLLFGLFRGGIFFNKFFYGFLIALAWIITNYLP